MVWWPWKIDLCHLALPAFLLEKLEPALNQYLDPNLYSLLCKQTWVQNTSATLAKS